MGISLDARYTYEMDEGKKVLKVRKNPKYKGRVWREGISSLSAIVGSNGVGKTSMMEAMLLMAKARNENAYYDAIILYEEADEYKLYKLDSRECRVDGLEVNEHSPIPDMGIFYFSSYFRPYQYIQDYLQGEIAGLYNATDTWRIANDLAEYSKMKQGEKNESLKDYLDAMHIQDDNRIVQMLSDVELRDFLPGSAIPQYLLIQHSESGYITHKQGLKSPATWSPQFGMLYHEKEKEARLASIAYAYFYNMIAEGKWNGIYVEMAQATFDQVYQNTHQTKNALDAAISACHAYKEPLTKLQDVIAHISEVCSYKEDTDVLYVDLKDQKNRDGIKKLMEYFHDTQFTKSHYFDFSIARKPAKGTQLSSGEYDMMKVFSRLYDAVIEAPMRRGSFVPQLILLDEAENSYHPEWQRQFVKMLTDYLIAMYHKREEVKEFQVVLTTHSPILLSDIPVSCTNYLYRDEKRGDVLLAKDQPETFGANIYDLYKDSFFMKKGVVGQFAYDMIEALREDIENAFQEDEDETDEFTQRIEQIGDEVIRRYLLSLIEEKNPKSMVTYYKQKIQELGGK